MSHEQDDADTNVSGNANFDSVLSARVSRREMFGGMAAIATIGAGAASNASAQGVSYSAGNGGGNGARHRALKLNFNPVAKSLEDAVAVPAGYSYDVLYALGDPIAAHVSDYANDGTDNPATYVYRSGDHHDGMFFFGMGPNGRYQPNTSARGLLCLNHEAITPAYLHPTGQTVVAGARTVAEEVQREFYLHGVSVIEVVGEKGRRRDDWSACFKRRYRPGRNIDWDYQQRSRYNRRVHTLTDMRLSGPVAGTPYLVTRYSSNGTRTRGTVNNCANGYTPWGTYLTCEENLAGYFRRIAATDNPNRTREGSHGLQPLRRRGHRPRAVGHGDARHGRQSLRPLEHREARRFGRWQRRLPQCRQHVRLGARDRSLRSALHAEEAHRARPLRARRRRDSGRSKPGEPLVWYIGDDSRNEYIYKFVSTEPWDPRDANGGMAAGDKYLDAGTLYVAQFLPDGTGQWLELAFGKNGITAANPAYAFADQADVLVQRPPRSRCGGRHQDGSSGVGRGESDATARCISR